jgi:hypothetical protein
LIRELRAIVAGIPPRILVEIQLFRIAVVGAIVVGVRDAVRIQVTEAAAGFRFSRAAKGRGGIFLAPAAEAAAGKAGRKRAHHDEGNREKR